MPPLIEQYLDRISWVCEGGKTEVRVHHAVCRRGSCLVHATVDSIEALGKVITYPTQADEYLILRHLHNRLRPPAAVPKPLCRAVGEYRGILTERVEGETLDTLWARGEGPSPELVGETLKELHKALADLETPWCYPGNVNEGDIRMWGLRPCLRAGLVAVLATALREWIALDAAETVLENCEMIKQLARASVGSRKQCIHGDLHLGQIIWAKGLLYFTDFSGEPLRWPAPQACSEPPARDLAALIRSVDYLASMGHIKNPGNVVEGLLHGYGWVGSQAQLIFWIIERASYELVYELIADTGLVSIPSEALLRMLRGGYPY